MKKKILIKVRYKEVLKLNKFKMVLVAAFYCTFLFKLSTDSLLFKLLPDFVTTKLSLSFQVVLLNSEL